MTTIDSAPSLTEDSVTRLLDEAAIRDATARFADAATSGDYDGFRALWADDAEWVIGGTQGQPFERRAKGIDDIVSMFRNLRDERDYFVQFAVQGSIEINGDEATARCLCPMRPSGQPRARRASTRRRSPSGCEKPRHRGSSCWSRAPGTSSCR
jgi:ketosteroid isomerase-like protein